nr:TonB-dependent receptor [Acanthopleuribacter pedis]
MAQGQVIGKVLTAAGRQPDVQITLRNASGAVQKSTVSDQRGSFRFRDLDADTYILNFSGDGLETYVRDNVVVPDGQIVVIEVTMEPTSSLVNVLRVASASRRAERIVEAPAAVSFVSAQDISAQSGHNQFPRILQNKPGVEIAQSGIYDFNLNTRGFNSSLNRRILTLVDGRDVSTTLLGNPEWSAMATNLDEVENIELVRGPGSALYGANAFNGVLNITTKRPVDSLGGWFSLTGGELDTKRAELRYAGEFGFGWSYRVTGSWTESDTWTQSRNSLDSLEYAGLDAGDLEAFSVEEGFESTILSARFDKEFLQGWVFSVEVGTTTVENPTAVTGIGRVQINEVERPYFRSSFSTNNWEFSFWRYERDTPEGQTALANGAVFYEDSYNQQLEIQANYDFFDERLLVTFGGSYSEQEVDTATPAGNQSLISSVQDGDQQAVYAQATIKLTDQFDFILAGRYDESSLIDSQFSPKGGLVWKLNTNNTVRFTYNEAFQAPTYSEFFLRAPTTTVPYQAVVAGVAQNLAAAGVPVTPEQLIQLVGWQNGPGLGFGNTDLEPEEVTSFELGYKGVINEKLFLTVDLFSSNLKNFVSDLSSLPVPGVPGYQMTQADQQRITAAFGPQLAPLVIGGLVQGLGAVGTGFTNYSSAAFGGIGENNLAEGQPFATFTYQNAGEVDTEGFDIGVQYFFDDNWSFLGNVSWFDFDVVSGNAATLVPNAPETKYNLGVSYKDARWNGSLNYRWVDDFFWSAGVFEGEVPSYDIIDLILSYNVLESLRFELNASNVTDEEHFEIFGGSLIGRRIHFTANYRF